MSAAPRKRSVDLHDDFEKGLMSVEQRRASVAALTQNTNAEYAGPVMLGSQCLSTDRSQNQEPASWQIEGSAIPSG